MIVFQFKDYYILVELCPQAFGKVFFNFGFGCFFKDLLNRTAFLKFYPNTLSALVFRKILRLLVHYYLKYKTLFYIYTKMIQSHQLLLLLVKLFQLTFLFLKFLNFSLLILT